MAIYRDCDGLRMRACLVCGVFYERPEAATSGLFYLVRMKKRRIRKKSGQNQEKELEAKKKRKQKQESVTLF